MRCYECPSHVDDTHGEGIIKINDQHWLHLSSVPSERLCCMNREEPWLVGSFKPGGLGHTMVEGRHPWCPYKEK